MSGSQPDAAAKGPRSQPPADPSLPARTRAAAWIGAGVAGLSRRLGRGGGSVVGGRAMLAVDPAALRHLAHGRTVALVSGTNGKTTTTSLLRAGLASTGPVATNMAGANLPPGLAAALAAAGDAPLAALEVDEAWLARVVADSAPRVVALLNLSRDQLDRNNEVRVLAGAWRRMCGTGGPQTVVANADDPLVAWAALAAPKVRWVGAGQPWTADAAGCPACGARIVFEDDGDWACTRCALARPPLDVRIDGDNVVGADGVTRPLRLSLPGRANRADATIALTAAAELGADPERALEGMRTVEQIVGRYKVVQAGEVEARLLLAKNPAGWLEVLDVVRPAPRPVVVAINARIADGRDPSWLWDVPFERLAGRLVVSTGERSRDLAVRLHYADVEHRRVDDPLEAIRVAGIATPSSEPPSVDVIGNYTAFQVIRHRLDA